MKTKSTLLAVACLGLLCTFTSCDQPNKGKKRKCLAVESSQQVDSTRNVQNS